MRSETVTPSAESHFAWLRTRFAVDRTFMAWLRTTASLIGFGFTIFEFFSRMSSVEGGPRPHAPAGLGLTLVAAGVVGLAIAMVQYIGAIRHLESNEYAAIAKPRPSSSAA